MIRDVLPHVYLWRDPNDDERRSWFPHGYWREAVLARAQLAASRMQRYAAQDTRPVPADFQHLIDEVHRAARSFGHAHHAWLSLHTAEVLLAQHVPPCELDLQAGRATALLQTLLKPDDPRRPQLEAALVSPAPQKTADPEQPSPVQRSPARRLVPLRRRKAREQRAAEAHAAERRAAEQGTAEERSAECRAREADAAACRKRAAIGEALRVAFSEQDEQYARVRSFRNLLLWCFFGLIALSVALAVIGWIDPNHLPLCFYDEDNDNADLVSCPLGKDRGATSADAALVEFLGSVGGGVAAVVAIRRLQGTTTPFGVPLMLALIKLPLGAITALAGLLLIHGRFVPGLSILDTRGQILAYAIVLGYAQQAFTRFVDRRGREVLEAVPAKSSRKRRRPPEADRRQRPAGRTSAQRSAGGSTGGPGRAGTRAPAAR
ncbi:MAG: hypothetical protein M3211_00130 [Actinomycetota bacterium]|nr:hypothetical protein [Actinomycetota bacterium]